jgi:gluconokinase
VAGETHLNIKQPANNKDTVMPHVPNLRSVYSKVGRLIYFGRMLDKIRLHASGNLPLEYLPYLGDEQFYTLDGRCCRFLGVRYTDIREQTLKGDADDDILIWTHSRGTPRNDEECHIWNRFILKLGWRDERSSVLAERIADPVFKGMTIETLVDHIECDEGRDPVADRAWDSI